MSNCSLSSKRTRNFADDVDKVRFSAEKAQFSLVRYLSASLRSHVGLFSFFTTLSEFLSLARSNNGSVLRAYALPERRGVFEAAMGR